MHTQEEFNRFALKMSSEDSLQGFQIPYIEDLINIDPGTLWGKFLLKEREEYAFSGPQVRACMGQQPGALSSKRDMQPLLATGLVKEAAFQCGIRLASASWLPSDEVAFTEDMLFSAAWSVQNRTTRRRQRRVFTQILKLSSRLQPLQKRLKMSAVPHQHNFIDTNVALVIISMYLIKWPVNMLPTRLPQGRNLASTIAATGVCEEFQEETPPMTKEELLSNNHRQGLIESFRQAKMDKHADFLFQNCLKRMRESGPSRCCNSRKLMRCFQMVSADARLQHRTGIRQTEAHRRRREKHEQSRCQDEERVRMHTALQPAVYIASWHSLWPKDAGRFRQEEQRAECFEHSGEDLNRCI